jgi:hypothetical protein
MTAHRAHPARRLSRTPVLRAPRARGGASSLLRLSQALSLPAAPAMAQWVERAARALVAPQPARS